MSTPSRDWKETSPPGEAERFTEYARRFGVLQGLAAKGGSKKRALHAKSHGGFEASLEVLADLPEHARHGLFAKPGKFEAIVRYSNGSGAVRHDKAGDVRGIAVKILGVEGKKVLVESKTQDFLAILASATPFRTADEFVEVVWAMRSPPLALPRLVFALGPFRPFGLVKKLIAGTSAPAASLVGTRFFSALPIQCGPFAVRFRFTPEAGAERKLGEAKNLFADDLADRLRAAPLTYTMALQFFVDEARTPIEDASVDWPEDISPHVDVARLVLAKQDAASDRGKKLAEVVERLSFDPWHALTSHKPLGGMMRARKEAYLPSTRGRDALPEPETIDALLSSTT